MAARRTYRLEDAARSGLPHRGCFQSGGHRSRRDERSGSCGDSPRHDAAGRRGRRPHRGDLLLSARLGRGLRVPQTASGHAVSGAAGSRP